MYSCQKIWSFKNHFFVTENAWSIPSREDYFTMLVTFTMLNGKTIYIIKEKRCDVHMLNWHLIYSRMCFDAYFTPNISKCVCQNQTDSATLSIADDCWNILWPWSSRTTVNIAHFSWHFKLKNIYYNLIDLIDSIHIDLYGEKSLLFRCHSYAPSLICVGNLNLDLKLYLQMQSKCIALLSLPSFSSYSTFIYERLLLLL